jgi:hypothetical protein
MWLDDVEQDWGREPCDRWVRLMADVGAPGVWHRDGTAGLPEALPISPMLGERIYRWQAWYDREEARHEAGTAWEFDDDWDLEAFTAEGLAIARALKAELPPDWTAVYFDLAALKRHGGWRSPAERRLWEYEIQGMPPAE